MYVNAAIYWWYCSSNFSFTSHGSQTNSFVTIATRLAKSQTKQFLLSVALCYHGNLPNDSCSVTYKPSFKVTMATG